MDFGYKHDDIFLADREHVYVPFIGRSLYWKSGALCLHIFVLAR